MDATAKSDQRREEEAEGEAEEEAPEEGAEGSGDVRVLNSNDLRMAMIPGYLEYARDYEANKRRALHGMKPVLRTEV